MTERNSLLAAIRENPADDLPRLVYADFLEETGDPERAEFIRLQCESEIDSPRTIELLEANEDRWKIPNLRGTQQFRRGFVESIGTSAEWLLGSAERIFEQPVRELRIYNAERFADELAQLPGLNRLEALDLTNDSFGSAERIHRFLAYAKLERLQTFRYRNNNLWPEGLQAIASSAIGPRLKHLDVSGNPLGDEGAAVIARGFPALETLTFPNHMVHYADSLHSGGLSELCRSTSLKQIRSIDLGGHYVGDAGLIGLIHSPLYNRLEFLSLASNEIGELGEVAFEELKEAGRPAALRRFDLRRNRINSLAAQALIDWYERTPKLVVDLRDCDFDERAAEIVRSANHPDRFLLTA